MIKQMEIDENIVKAIQKIVNKKTREQLQRWNITDKYIEVTDGRALLRVPFTRPEDMPSGPYEVVGQVKTRGNYIMTLKHRPDETYPKTDSVFPDYRRDTFAFLPLDESRPFRVSESVIALYQLTGNAYNGDYLSALLPLGLTWQAFKVQKEKPAFMATMAGHLFIVMPFLYEVDITTPEETKAAV